ncbi:hypothetical protein RB653_009975 [Dictyostelium firmibasis]|uniref:G-protein coupled receptors family 3 profile domain-containing protein n=1 Tax=Dictyostelium firmibasis TaxID=79012 RepID=A0AAN7TS59_9MYCE
MVKIKFFLILLISILMNLYIVNSSKCKISLLLSGDWTDMGYNYQMNNARIRAESVLKLEMSIYYKNLEVSIDLAREAIEDSIKKGANLIVISSSIHTNIGYEYARLNKNKEIYWLIRGRGRPVPDDLPKVTIINFNTHLLHYTLGLVSGYLTTSGAVGFISPGPNILSLANSNSFYLGALASRNNVTFLNAYTGSWFNPEVSYKASQMLISNGVDFIGMSQDDMSVQKALMDHGKMGLGITGYSNRLIWGSDIALSYITDWSDVFIKYAGHIINETWPQYDSYYTTLAEGGSLLFDEFSFRVPKTIQNLVSLEINKLKNSSYQPFRCNPMYTQLNFTFDSNGCPDDTEFKNTKLLLKGDKISKVIDLGLYTIPIEFVDYSNSMKIGLTIVSGICILFSILSMILVIVFRRAKIIKSASPAFCLLILFGCIIIFTGCIIFSLSPTNGNCRARVWLLSIGYTIFLGSLLVKNWRIWLLFDNPKLKKRSITNWKLYPFVAGILAVDVLILAFWQGLGNIRSESRIGIDSLTKYQYSNVCSSDDQGAVALYILLVFHGIKLLAACFISFKIKAVDIEEFNESKPIASSVYIITFCLFIVIPLMVSPQSVTSQVITIVVCAIVTTIISISLLFGSKFYMMFTEGLALNQTFATSTKSSSFTLSLERQKSKSNGFEIEDSDESEEKLPQIKNYSNSEIPNLQHNHSRLAQFSSDSCTSAEQELEKDSKLDLENNDHHDLIENGNKVNKNIEDIENGKEEEEEEEETIKEKKETQSEIQKKRLSENHNNPEIGSDDV